MPPANQRRTRATLVARAAMFSFAVLAVMVTACVWAGLSLTEVLHVVGAR
jgi:hypothetical protein